MKPVEVNCVVVSLALSQEIYMACDSVLVLDVMGRFIVSRSASS